MVGWIIDSGYRSIVDRRWTNAGYFIGPFCPIYGFGGLLLLLMVSMFEDQSFLVRCVIYFTGMTGVEFFGGLFSTYILKVKLWDYSDAPLNIMGQVDLLHSFYWLILALMFEGLVWPVIDFINENAGLVEWVDRVVFFLAIGTFSLALIRKMVKERNRVKPFIKGGTPKILWKHMDRMNSEYVELMEKLDEDVVIPSEKATKEWFDRNEHYLDEMAEKVQKLQADSARIRNSVPARHIEKDLKVISSIVEKRREDLDKLRELERKTFKGKRELRKFNRNMNKMKGKVASLINKGVPNLSWSSYIRKRGRSFHPNAFLDRFPAWQVGWKKRREDLMTLIRSENG